MNRRDFMLKAFKGMVITGLLPQFSSCLRSNGDKKYFFPLDQSDMNYVQLNFYGGPVRWGFDNFLRPTESHEFIPTRMVGGRFKDGMGDVELKWVKKHGYLVPDFWDLKMKSGVEHSTLLQNMISIRGVDINVSGHPHGIIKTVRPDSTQPSIQGVISYHSKSPLPSIIFGSNPATRSYESIKRGGIKIPLNERNLLEQILSPFVLAEEKSLFGSNNDKKKIITKVLDNLKLVEGAEDKYLKELYGSLDLFIDNLVPFLDEYETYLSKYEKLILENIRSFDGLSLDKLSLRTLDMGNLNKFKIEEDWGRYKIDYQTYLRGDNLEEMLSSADLGFVPHQFACTEFLLKRGLTNSLMMSTPNEMGSFLYNCSNKNNVNQKSFLEGKIVSTKDKFVSIQMDSHNTGTILQTIASFMFYRGLVPCLDRLKNELKAIQIGDNKSLFDKTLIHLCSEFERIPTEFESGTEHNHRSHTSSFLSGSIKKFQIAGNIKTGNNVYGTIGTAGHVEKIGRNLDPRDIYQSICSIMKIKSPVSRAEVLLDWKGDEITSTLNELKNIEGVSC